MPSKYLSSHHPKSDRVVDCLRSAIVDAGAGLADVPKLLRQVIVEELWRKRKNSQGENKIIFKDFTDFVQANPPEGLRCDLSTLKKLCRDDVQTLDLLARVSRIRSRGGDRRSKNFKFDNVKFEKPATGNSSQYALDRLRLNRPDLHHMVLNGNISVNQAMISAKSNELLPFTLQHGNISVNQAMISAGFRKRKIQLTLEVFSFAEFIHKNFTQAEITNLIDELRKGLEQQSSAVK